MALCLASGLLGAAVAFAIRGYQVADDPLNWAQGRSRRQSTML